MPKVINANLFFNFFPFETLKKLSSQQNINQTNQKKIPPLPFNCNLLARIAEIERYEHVTLHYYYFLTVVLIEFYPHSYF